MPADALGGRDGSGETKSSDRGGPGSPGGVLLFAVETADLTRRFGSVTAVDALSLRVPAGSIFGLLGRNGAGKTVTIKMLTTLLPPTSGRAAVAGFDVVTESIEVRRCGGGGADP